MGVWVSAWVGGWVGGWLERVPVAMGRTKVVLFFGLIGSWIGQVGWVGGVGGWVEGGSVCVS